MNNILLRLLCLLLLTGRALAHRTRASFENFFSDVKEELTNARIRNCSTVYQQYLDERITLYGEFCVKTFSCIMASATEYVLSLPGQEFERLTMKQVYQSKLWQRMRSARPHTHHSSNNRLKHPRACHPLLPQTCIDFLPRARRPRRQLSPRLRLQQSGGRISSSRRHRNIPVSQAGRLKEAQTNLRRCRRRRVPCCSRERCKFGSNQSCDKQEHDRYHELR